ncbi:MAG: PKD domain-containing protein [Blastococcus sp.]
MRTILFRRFATTVCGVLLPALVLTTALGAGAASAAGVAQPGVVTAAPSALTPQVLDNQVLDLAEVGNRIVVAGSFTQVQDAPTNGGATFAQPYVFAFDPATGKIDRAFAPAVNGVVNTVIAGPNGTVFLGGTFSSVNGATVRKLTQLSLATGARTSFKTPALDGAVNSLVMAGSRLVVAGIFTTVAGVPHGGLATLNATTGALDEYLGVDVTGHHNYPDQGTAQAAVGVDKLAISPDGTRLVAIGNFKQADGLSRDQVAMVLLQPDAAVVDPNWATTRYSPACFSWAFDSYVRDVQFAPDGSFFSISSTGGANTGTLCDSVTRWETTDTGADVQPRWVDYAGGDTIFSVEITGSVVYVGGHMRWMNNSFGHDSPGAGAVPRPGLAALDPRTGVPLSWNPGRNPRGVGARALLATATGLYVGMDTPYIGNRQYLRPGLAYFPLAGGAATPSEDTGALPANVYLAGRQAPGGGTGSTGTVLYRVNAGGPELAATDGGPAWAADDGASNPLRSDGSNAAAWAPGAAEDGTVPASTPPAVFDTERWDPADATEMQWHFPVAAGTSVEVRVYLANRCGCTSTPGARAFDVSLDGNVVLNDYDIVADVGDQVGTMKSFPVTSDGSVDLSFGHVVENPLVDAIEIVESTGTPATGPVGVDDVVSRYFDGTTAGPDTPVDGGGLEWSRARGAFMAGNTLFYGYPDANGVYGLYERTFDGTAFGAATLIDPYDDPFWSDVQTGSGQTYRGVRPSFYNQLSSVSSMFFQNGRLYYTRTGMQALYYRAFSVDSGVVGADEFVAAGWGFADVSGAFLSGGQLYAALRSTGELVSVPFADGVPTGSPVVVGGPAVDGRNWAARALFLGPGGPPAAPNQAPTASFTSSCTDLACTFDGSGSSDPDGTVASYAWDFGDGSTGTGATPDHTFTTAGDHPVTLTVTDDDGAAAQSTSTVTVNAPPPPAGIDLRGSAGTSARAVTSVAVTVPDAVQPGNGMVLVLSTNSGVTGTTPAGWTQVGAQAAAPSVSTQVFSRVAGATDAGSTVTVGLSGSAKATLQLAAYSGTSSTAPVASVTGAADSGGTSHTTPMATAPAGAWVVSVWSDKSASARSWTAPTGVTVRSSLDGVGTGDVATLLADSGGPVAAGTVGGLTATVNAASNRAAMLTVVLAPGMGGAPPANVAPTASFQYSCAGLTCSFDGTGSGDPDGAVASYAWDFGDGTTETGPAPAHTFAAAGDRQVTLTVTDDRGATGTTTSTVPVAPAPPAAGIGLQGSAGTAARQVTSVSVDVPASVRAGNGLVLVLSTNSTATGAAPAGWTQAGVQVSGSAPTTQVFQRVATAADAGSTVTVAISAQAKVTLQLLAYSGTAATGPVATVTGAGDGAGTSHTTPTATAPAGSWVISVWSDKQSAAREWAPPASGTTVRSSLAGIGAGDLATLVADSGGPVAAGTVGGLTATVPTASNRATMLTVVLAAA